MQHAKICRELITRNCATDFYGDEILGECGKFTEEYFESVREGGYTSIWIRGQLRNLVLFEEAPHWNNRNEERLKALNHIVATGRKSGIGIYLYINEPKGFWEDDPIFDKYPDLKGPFNPLSQHPLAQGIEPSHAFCTRSAFADTYLTEGFADLFAQCPDLAGVLMITASEILSHCYSNVDVQNLLNEDFKHREIPCPRCRGFSATATVVDVIERIRRGIRASSATARIVAWNWSWGMYEESPQRSILSGLSKDVTILCDMQRGGAKSIEGIDLVVDEYSFSYLGPSPLFLETAAAAGELGHELWAKIMVNVTHEFLVVPYLPLPFRLAKKMIAVRDLNSQGLMACWNYGGSTQTWMARLGSRIFTDDQFGIDKIDGAVRAVADAVYGLENSEKAFSAWTEFDAAFEYFPFDMFLIYYGPHMHGTGFEWAFTPEEIPMPWYFQNKASRKGTKLSDWTGSLSTGQIIQLFNKLLERWRRGLLILGEIYGLRETEIFDALPRFDEMITRPGFEDFNIARTIYFHFRSTVGFVEFRLATLEYFSSPVRQDDLKKTIAILLEKEKPSIRAMMQIVQAYSQIPFAEEAQKHLYSHGDLAQKLENIRNFSFREGQCL